ncbi:MAG: hemerythrin domain-containing protein [Actinomycetota bacterium]|nr:hemerythrin domain-containing protein [Actinomycetota bacterium]
MDAIEFLTQQHRQVEQLFDQYEQASGTGQRQELANEIVEDLKLHTTLEERFFYPTVRERIPDLEDQLLEDLEEHHAVELLLQEVTDADPSDERFDAKISVIQEQVQHHVQEEEQELFPQVRDGLGDDALQELGDRMRQAAERGGQEPTKDDLYQEAQDLDIEGRSKMDKDELAEAVEEHR